MGGDIYKIITNISGVSVLVPLIFGIMYFKIFNTLLKILFLYIVISVINELLGLSFVLTGFRNSSAWNTYTIIECTCITAIYWRIFSNKKAKIIMAAFYGVFILLCAYVIFVLKGFNKPDDILNTYESLFVLSLCWTYLYQIMKDLNVKNLKDDYFFWLNSAFVLYFSMAFFLFLFYKYIVNLPPVLYSFLWALHLLSNTTYNILLAVSIWKARLQLK